MPSEVIIYRVSEINRYLKGLLQGDPLLADLRVAGEISNFRHHRSGHIYFTLKDGKSSLRSVFFRRENLRCPFKLEDGMEVIVHGYISVYEPEGAYQLYVSEVEPAGVGALFLAFEQLKRKLEAEGLFDPALKKQLPRLPRKIGLVTATGGAALQDIMATIKKRFPHVHLLVVESLVQGAGAAADIVRALDLLNRRDDIDLIILTRGGGSLEDLWPFNEEPVARAINRSLIPVISAVGHETDYTIADFTADLRAATPTAAAAAAVPDISEINLALRQLRERAGLALQRRMQREKQLLDHVASERFFTLPEKMICRAREDLLNLEQSLRREMVRLLEIRGMKMSALLDKFESYSPLKIMNRGYSFCRDEEGNIVRSIKSIRIGQLLSLRFSDGRADCRTEKVEEESAVEG